MAVPLVWGRKRTCVAPARASPAPNGSLESAEMLSEAEKFVLEMSAEEVATPAAAAGAVAAPAALEAQLTSLRSQVVASCLSWHLDCCWAMRRTSM